MEKLKAVIARLDERVKSPVFAFSGIGEDVKLIRAALVEVEGELTLHAQCLRVLAQGLKNHEASHGKAKK